MVFYLGRVLPSDTYWYVIEIQNNYTRTGWILLKHGIKIDLYLLKIDTSKSLIFKISLKSENL